MIFGAIGDDFFILIIIFFLIKYYLDKKLRDLSSLSPPATSTPNSNTLPPSTHTHTHTYTYTHIHTVSLQKLFLDILRKIK